MSFPDFKENFERVFDRLSELAHEANTIINRSRDNSILKGCCTKDSRETIECIVKDLPGHLEKIRRKQMKCVFIGKTSNGKTATINAILGSKILPSDYGRTTSCFVTIEGCDGDAYFTINGKKETDIKMIIERANEISDNHATIDSHIKLYWPKNECNLLKDDVQLLDSPGVDYSKDNDKWIETYCLDSDLFVYVVNAQATINESERKFFRKVNKFIKNPNIFVVMNKWDLCDTPENEKQIDKVKEQHINTVHQFLRDDLKLKCDAREKTFFLSAKEQLDNCDSKQQQQQKQKQKQQQKQQQPMNDAKRVGRKAEFDRFDKTLCEQMSRYAIINKFGPHLDSAKEYLKDIVTTLKLFDNIKKENTKKSKSEWINEINKLINDIYKDIINKGERKIRETCPKLVMATMNEGQAGADIQTFIEENIIESLKEIFEKRISQLSTKMKNVFSSCSEFHLDDDVLCLYLPTSFSEEAQSLESELYDDMYKVDSAARNNYIAEKKLVDINVKSSKKRSQWAEVLEEVAKPLMIKFRWAGTIALSISAILKSSARSATESNKEEFEQQVRKNTEERLLSFMTDGYKENQREIEKAMSVLVTKFCNDQGNAHDILRSIVELRANIDDILEELDLEGVKIMSIKDYDFG